MRGSGVGMRVSISNPRMADRPAGTTASTGERLGPGYPTHPWNTGIFAFMVAFVTPLLILIYRASARGVRGPGPQGARQDAAPSCIQSGTKQVPRLRLGMTAIQKMSLAQ